VYKYDIQLGALPSFRHVLEPGYHRVSLELWVGLVVGLAVGFFAGDPKVGRDVGPFVLGDFVDGIPVG